MSDLIPCSTTVIFIHDLPGSEMHDWPELLWADVEFFHHRDGDLDQEAIDQLRTWHEESDPRCGMLLGYKLSDREWRQGQTSKVFLGHGLPTVEGGTAGGQTDSSLVSRADEWLSRPDGTKCIIAGKLLYVDQTLVQILLDGGTTCSIAITPPMDSELGIFLNPRFETGVRRAIRVAATNSGWKAAIQDIFEDVDGHGCPRRDQSPVHGSAGNRDRR